MFLLTSEFWFSVIRSTTPVLFATLAVSIAARGGVYNLAVEGIMLVCALTGVVVSAFTQSLFMGALAGILIGVAVALILGFFVMKMGADEIIIGIAINLAAIGGTTFVLYELTGDQSVSAALNSKMFPTVQIPLIHSIPVLGDIVSGHNILTYVAFLLIIIIQIMLNKTPLGIRIRAVGDNEDAARSVGINVSRIKVISLIFSGIISALGGMFLSMGYMTMFTSNMTAGRGYMALATDAMAASNPVGGLFASVIYGIADTLSIYVQQTSVPVEFVRMIPYVFIIIACAVFTYIRRKKNKEARAF